MIVVSVTPPLAGVTHTRAAVPAGSFSPRQHPRNGAHRASLRVVAVVAFDD
jgi:hypothetical protein